MTLIVLLVLFILLTIADLVLVAVFYKKKSFDNLLVTAGMSILIVCVLFVIVALVNYTHVNERVKGAELLQEDILKRFGLVVSFDDAQKMYESKQNGDDSYNEIIIMEEGNDKRVYKAFYRVDDGVVNIYKEKQDGIYVKIN